ncbi:hypothetical protein EVAR_44885_1 [Eumeta japonica]|uniref:Uncharacterized protein n=1 Tax=Eumeta variegata TaxID=151549 RepID=A0A4C1XMN7_EUMVA|nr:hypothetical protein EVAR_44885_1 [Eumeta japonica]
MKGSGPPELSLAGRNTTTESVTPGLLRENVYLTGQTDGVWRPGQCATDVIQIRWPAVIGGTLLTRGQVETKLREKVRDCCTFHTKNIFARLKQTVKNSAARRSQSERLDTWDAASL